METTDITTTILRSIRDDIAKLDAKLSAKIDGVETRLDAKIDGVEARLDAKIDGVETRLDAKIDRELRLVRDDMQKLVTPGEFHRTMQRYDERLDRVYACVVDLDARVTANHRELQSELRRIHVFMDAHDTLEGRVDRCELDIADLKQRVL